MAVFPSLLSLYGVPCEVRRAKCDVGRGGGGEGLCLVKERKEKAKLETPGHYGKYFSTNNYTGRPEHQATRRQGDNPTLKSRRRPTVGYDEAEATESDARACRAGLMRKVRDAAHCKQQRLYALDWFKGLRRKGRRGLLRQFATGA
jgi:hypothetical protein